MWQAGYGRRFPAWGAERALDPATQQAAEQLRRVWRMGGYTAQASPADRLLLLSPRQLPMLLAFTCPGPPLPAAGSSATAGGWASTGAGAGGGGACCTPWTTTTPGSMQCACCQVAASPRGAARALSTSGEAGEASLACWLAGMPAQAGCLPACQPASAASCLQLVAVYSGAESGGALTHLCCLACFSSRSLDGQLQHHDVTHSQAVWALDADRGNAVSGKWQLCSWAVGQFSVM